MGEQRDQPTDSSGLASTDGAVAARRRRGQLGIGLIVIAGLAVRGACLWLAPGHAFLADHIDYMVWSQYAYEHGPTRIYDLPQDTLINVNFPPWFAGTYTVTPYPNFNRCNYPPLAAYAFWWQGWLWNRIDRHIVTHEVMPVVADATGYAAGPVSSRVANTVTARSVQALLPIITDFLMAAGVALLAGNLCLSDHRRKLTTWAFGLTILTPPLFLDSAFWNQTDSWLACALVWCLYSLIAERYVAAGVLYGAALLTKAQAVLFLPVIGYVFLALCFMPNGSLRKAARLWRAAAAALVTLLLLAAPFSLESRGHPEHGAWRWLYRAYVEPMLHDYPLTTLRAFNLWWLDLATSGHNRAVLDSTARVFGLSKDTLGKVLLAGATLAAGIVCARRWRWSRPSWVMFAGLVFLAAFVFPTRVHERYIYYCLPFLIASIGFRRWHPVLLVLLVVATFELTWNLWYLPADAPPVAVTQSLAVQAWCTLLAAAAVASFLYALIAIAVRSPATLITRSGKR